MAVPAALETVWKLLEQGHGYVKTNEFWEAADCYCQAQEALRKLYEEADQSTDESIRIAQLYRQQADEYLIKARDCLVKALEKQMEEFQQEFAAETEFLAPLLEANETGRHRWTLLGRLLASPELLSEGTTTKGTQLHSNKSSDMSLEERLAQLNQNLPKNLLTTDQRMQQINKGLNRLGFSLYDHNSSQPTTKLEVPKSEQDEVDAIIAQAKQEVALLQTTEQATTNVLRPLALSTESTSSALENDSHDHTSDEDESSTTSQDADVDLSPEQLERIRDRVAEAQAELAQLLILLQPDEGGYTDIDFDPAPGKHALRRARRLLSESAKEWERKVTNRADT